jgi:hypothetical protein
MANSDFTCLASIQDDSKFVHQAMEQLGFVGEFADLPIADMSLILALAIHLKRSQFAAEVWES